MTSSGPPSAPTKGSVLLITENTAIPHDRRVLGEANALRDAGYVVSIICPTGPGYPERRDMIDEVAVYRHPRFDARTPLGYLVEYAGALAWELALAVRILRQRGVDVIHIANPPDTMFVIAALLKLRGTRVVFDQHDLGPELFEVKFGRRGMMWRALRVVERLSFRTADVSIATNESYRQIAFRRGHMAPEDVFVVRNGPDLDEPAGTPPGDQDLHHGRRHLIVFAGEMGSQDGVDFLLDAARQLVIDEKRDVHFVLAGPGSERDRLCARSVSLGLDDHVTFIDFVPHAELLGIVEAADICVSPDEKNPLNDQSTMVKVLEYMAAAKPIVQFDLHEGRVSAGDAALYARDNDPADLAAKIALLLEDPDLRQRMGQIGRQRVETSLAWQHQIPSLLAAYERLEEKRRPRRPWRQRTLGGAR